jgi:hypothetical protein
MAWSLNSRFFSSIAAAISSKLKTLWVRSRKHLFFESLGRFSKNIQVS